MEEIDKKLNKIFRDFINNKKDISIKESLKEVYLERLQKKLQEYYRFELKSSNNTNKE